MIALRRADDRGRANFGWLDSRHSFSFGQYYDPAHMGFGPLRVINEDRVAPGGGFPTHGHADMEILSYVLDGALEHRDSIGSGAVIRPGELQRMTAGTGIRHSEFNHSRQEPVHFLQIWILPERTGLQPGYEQKRFPLAEEPGRLHLIAARDGRDGAVTLHQDVDLYAGRLRSGDSLTHELAADRLAWLQVARGAVSLAGTELRAGDGVAIGEPGRIDLSVRDSAEILLFDMTN
jgi:redox-sensitive bicupin YhaK (pirin superfamily)